MRLPSGFLPGPSLRSLLSKVGIIPRALDVTYQSAIKTIILIVGVVLVGSAYEAVRSESVVIEPILVPHKLEEDGYTGAVVARLLLDQVQAIRQFGNGQPAVNELREDSTVNFQSEDPFASLATVQVPSSSLSMRSITVMLRDFLGIPERKIGGAITIRRPVGKDAPVYRVTLLLGPSAGLVATPQEDTSLDQAILLSARSIARQYDPVGLASYYLANDELPAVKQLADDLMATREVQYRRMGLLIRGLHEAGAPDRIARFQEAVAEDPGFSAAYNALGNALLTSERIDEAISNFDEAIRLDPGNAAAYRNRAAAYKHKKQFQRAIDDFEKASQLRAKAQTFFELGYAYESLPTFDPADPIRAYDVAIRLDPTHHWALSSRCYMKAVLGDRSAIADCNKAVRLNDSFETHDGRAFAHLKLQEFDKAIEDYGIALGKLAAGKGDVAYSLFGLGVAKRRKGDLAGGDLDIIAARKQDPDIDAKMAKFKLTP